MDASNRRRKRRQEVLDTKTVARRAAHGPRPHGLRAMVQDPQSETHGPRSTVREPWSKTHSPMWIKSWDVAALFQVIWSSLPHERLTASQTTSALPPWQSGTPAKISYHNSGAKKCEEAFFANKTFIDKNSFVLKTHTHEQTKQNKKRTSTNKINGQSSSIQSL